jgi:hypothetical protein
MKKPFSISMIVSFLKSLKCNLKFLPFNDPIELIVSQKDVIIKYIILDVFYCVNYECTHILSEGVIFEQYIIVSPFYFHCKISRNFLKFMFLSHIFGFKK